MATETDTDIIEVRNCSNVPENIKEIMENRGFYELDESDEGTKTPVLYFFPAPLRLKIQDWLKLDGQPHFAIVQGGEIKANEGQILSQFGKNLRYALYTLEKTPDGKWFFKTMENSTSKVAEGFQRNIAGIISKKNSFCIPEEFPSREVLEKLKIKITHQGLRFVYRSKK